uniref:Permuted papain-like amidase enzyme, YaeF/YiiX, C92 family n=1 Tax=Ascaris lumbricoides TaxID=6252 RepID=A0A0M3IB74_ASCLU
MFLPNPFATNTACSILLKPSSGGFHRYQIGDDLHIGISDSESVVYSYWKNGIAAESSSWQDAISVYSFEAADFDFDEVLRTFIDHNIQYFPAEGYDANTWNCFDFIIAFMIFVGVIEKGGRSMKDQFVSRFVEAPLQRAVRYCKLVQRVYAAEGRQVSLPTVKIG